MSNQYGTLPGRYPAIVRTYDPVVRICRVEIPGLTDGADVFPIAEIEYPIGFRTHGQYATEIEILAGDEVWISFIGGDPRYPVITGYRAPERGNSNEWRRVHHANLEFLADALVHVKAGGDITIETAANVTVKAAHVTVDAPATECTGNLKVAGGLNVVGISRLDGEIQSGGNIASKGGIKAAGDIIGGNISLTGHKHQEQGDGNPVSPPIP